MRDGRVAGDELNPIRRLALAGKKLDRTDIAEYQVGLRRSCRCVEIAQHAEEPAQQWVLDWQVRSDAFRELLELISSGVSLG